MERLKGKVAIITGTGSGIGEATARLMAREGASEEFDSGINDQIDAAYRAKYRFGGGYVNAMVTGAACAATINLVPRVAGHS